MSSDTMQLLASNDINTAETELINSHHNLASTTASTPINLPKASPLPPILNNESNSLLKHIEDLHLHHISRNHNHTMTPATAQSNEIDALVMDSKRVDEYSSQSSKAESTMLVSLRVCKECQNTLLHAFNHCLSKQGNSTQSTAAADDGNYSSIGVAPAFTMDSIHQIDEVEDGKQLKEPPYLALVKDPTKPRNTIFLNSTDKVARDRATFADAKKSSSIATTTKSIDVPNLSLKSSSEAGVEKKKDFAAGKSAIDSGTVFSGTLYKRTLEAKAKEIQSLREKLYDKIASEQFEHENVERLRHALNKAVRFCAIAEEWHVDETSRLQYDVRCLKAEMSSLMAFLINSEEEKRRLNVSIGELSKTIEVKDARILEMDTAYQDVKVKLHHAYKEYLSMTDTMKKLEKEATLGPEIVRNRNEILQRNLDKLSRDFETASKEVALSQLKIKELEFELEEMMAQFNTCGEAKRVLEEEKEQLLKNLAHTTNDLKELNSNHEVALVKISHLEEKIQSIANLHSTTKTELEGKIQSLTKEVEVMINNKRDSEATIKQLKIDNEKLSSALKSVNRAKDQMETDARQTEKKHEKETQQRDDKIKELVELRSEVSKTIRKLQEHKEKLMFQVTDLQNSLDREAATVNSLNFELTQLRKSTDEQITSLKDQLEKVNLARANLTSDKRQLMEKIKSVRSDLAKKEDDFNHLTAELNKFKEMAHDTETNLKKELANLNDAHKNLQQEFASSEHKNQVLLDTNVSLNKQCDSFAKKQTVLEQQEVTSREEIRTLQSDNSKLSSELKQAITERTDMKFHLDSVLEKVNELSANLAQQERETRSAIGERDAELIKLNATLYTTQEGFKRMERAKIKLHSTACRLAEELERVKDAFAKETNTREKLEISIDDLRHSYSSEKRIRLDMERMKMKLNRTANEREEERLNSLLERNRLLIGISRGLSDEYRRLEHLSHLLPGDSDLNTTPGPSAKEFHAAHHEDNHGQEIATHNVGRESKAKKKVMIMIKPARLSLYNVIQQAEKITVDNE